MTAASVLVARRGFVKPYRQRYQLQRFGRGGFVSAALRTGITAGAQLWRQSAPVLRAIVENWRTDPRLEALWTEQMQTFTDATVAQINADPRARERLAGQDIPALASALTWLGERLYYLAATGTPPFDDQDTLVATLLHIWTTALYEDTSTP